MTKKWYSINSQNVLQTGMEKTFDPNIFWGQIAEKDKYESQTSRFGYTIITAVKNAKRSNKYVKLNFTKILVKKYVNSSTLNEEYVRLIIYFINKEKKIYEDENLSLYINS